MSKPSFNAENIKVTSQDYFKAFMYRNFRKYKTKTVFTILATLGLIYFMFSNERNSTAILIAAVLYPPLLYGLLILIDTIFIWLYAKKLGKAELSSIGFAIKDKEDGFESVSERGKGYFKWSDFKCFFISKNFFLLETKTRNVLCFPKRFFDETSRENFETQVRQNIK